MSSSAKAPIDMYVCYGVERGTKFPHWMLMLATQGEQTGTWYHSTGGPTQNKSYEVTIEAGKRVNSRRIQTTEKIGTIDPGSVNKVKAAAQRVPAQQCQRYVVGLVHELEQKGLVAKGTAVQLNGKVQMSGRAQAYAVQNPVDHPSGAYVPPAKQAAESSSSGNSFSGRRSSGSGRSSGGNPSSTSGRSSGGNPSSTSGRSSGGGPSSTSGRSSTQRSST